MTTYTEKIESAQSAMREARDAGDQDGFMAAFEEWQEAEQERDRARREAVDRGLEGTNIDVLSRESLARFVLRTVDVLDERYAEKPDLNTEEGRLYFLEEFTRYWTEEGKSLLAKLLSGYFVEEDATDGVPIPDGIVGRAVDRAIEDLLPYATASRNVGWYNQEVAPKL